MNSMPFRQLKSFLKILIGVQYESEVPEFPNKKTCPYPNGYVRSEKRDRSCITERTDIHESGKLKQARLSPYC